ncbi:MAG: hypothetical protein ACYCWE_19245 [Eubacteriales bacterium]
MSKETNPNGYLQFLTSFSESQRTIMNSINHTSFLQIAQLIPKLKTNEDMLTGINTALLEMAAKAAYDNAHTLQIQQSLLNNMLTEQWRALAFIENSTSTGMLKQIKHCLLDAKYNSCYEVLDKTIKNNIVEVANIAFLKLSDILTWNWPDISLPIGFQSTLNNLTAYSAERLSSCEDISFITKKRKFIDEKKPENESTVTEINHICVVADVFKSTNNTNEEDLLETELMDLMSCIQDTPTHASQHPAGRKIDLIIGYWKYKINFDCETYYHARSRNESEAPYPHNEMLNAPAGITYAGRYNFTGQAYYYFTDSVNGAKIEVKKHCGKGKRIQVAEIKPNKHIAMIDLSGDWKNRRFLRYLRFPVVDYTHSMPREYLIPCFVSDCCRRRNIDGIKYSGSAEHNNYVSWNAGYFDFVAMVYDGE